MQQTEPFKSHATEYDAWFDKYPFVFESEVEALREMLPPGLSQGIEVGLGTGRFTLALGIKEGIEPADALRKMAISRGIETMTAVAEKLPYKDLHFDFVLMASCISYFKDANAAIREAHRVLKRNGCLILGFIERDSTIGKYYESIRDDSTFYKTAVFYPADKVIGLIKDNGFQNLEITQTLFGELDSIHEIQKTKPGYGEGSFVVIKAIKK
jgi:ubiquinone/menaquinone biosynthesis C-methylase UbiE